MRSISPSSKVRTATDGTVISHAPARGMLIHKIYSTNHACYVGFSYFVAHKFIIRVFVVDTSFD